MAIGDRLGHETIEITLRYAHLFPTTQKAIVKSLDDLREVKAHVG